MTGFALASHIGLWVVVGFLILLVVGLTRQIGLLHRRIAPSGARMGHPGPAIGELAPELGVPDIDGRVVTLAAARQRKTLLAFISPTCPVCSDLMPSLRSIRKSDQADVEVVLVSLSGDEDENRAYRQHHRMDGTSYITSLDVSQRYDVGAPPYAVLVGADGRVKSKGLVGHLEQLESLLTAESIGHATLESYMKAMRGGATPQFSGTAASRAGSMSASDTRV